MFAHASVCLTLIIPLIYADFLGPRYPSPTDLSGEASLVSLSWQNLTATLDAHVNGSTISDNLIGIENITFSVGAFSIHDPAVAASHQYHHTGSEIASSEYGVNQVDGDTIYRGASVTKLFTVFASMLELTEEELNRPFTQIFPGLEEFMQQNSASTNPAEVINWREVTPLALAAQQSGVPTNAWPFLPGDLYLFYAAALAANDSSAVDPVSIGLPPIALSEELLSGACGIVNLANCSGELYVQQQQAKPPNFQTWSSPSYSNNGLALLGVALSAITGKTLDQIFSEAIFAPLGMTSSNISNPVDSLNRSAVAGDVNLGFLADQGVSRASGGLFTTINDLAKFSTGVLNSTLMSRNLTRKWMKPMTHTANPYFSVGAPWEIARYTHPEGSSSAGAVTDIYTKLGDSGNYGGVVALIPEYGAGFNVLVASSLSQRSDSQALVMDAVVRNLLPALEAQAALEANDNFVGSYASSTEGLNSSLTLHIDEEIPGLTITEWISNGTDVLANQADLLLGSSQLRLLPTVAEIGDAQYAFRLSRVTNATVAAASRAIGPFTDQLNSNINWLSVGSATYVDRQMDLFTFDVDEGGRASAITPMAFGVSLERQQ